MKSAALKTWLQLLIKVLVTGICLWYVIQKINWQQSWNVIQQSNVFWLIVAVLFMAASKLVAAYRLNIYFKNIQVHLAHSANLRLYWLGMFYNIFLPGGIGGDAYKIILLNKAYEQSPKMLTAAVFLDRTSGVVGIGVLGVVYYLLAFHGNNYSWLLVVLIVPGMLLYYFIVKKVFPSFIAGFWPTFFMGVVVQALQVVCVYCLLQALHLHGHATEYVLIFLLSSLVAVLPFTIGGLGAREVVFIWGSQQFMLNQNESVCISLLVYLISVFISLPGVYWLYHHPLQSISSVVKEKE